MCPKGYVSSKVIKKTPKQTSAFTFVTSIQFTLIFIFIKKYFLQLMKKTTSGGSRIYSGTVSAQCQKLGTQGISIHLPKWNQGIIDMLWSLPLL
jgi:hypothetical protein